MKHPVELFCGWELEAKLVRSPESRVSAEGHIQPSFTSETEPSQQKTELLDQGAMTSPLGCLSLFCHAMTSLVLICSERISE